MTDGQIGDEAKSAVMAEKAEEVERSSWNDELSRCPSFTITVDSNNEEKEEKPAQHPLDRLLQHATSKQAYERRNTGKLLVEYFRSAVDYEFTPCIQEAFMVVYKIVGDREMPVRSALLDQLQNVAMLCREAPHLFGEAVPGYILDIIFKYLRDWDHEIRQSAEGVLLGLFKRQLLTESLIQAEVCPKLLKLTIHAKPVQLHQTISLICKIGPYIGSEVMEEVFLDKFLELCEDKNFYVRRICTSYFGEFCASVSQEAILSKLFPEYIILCMDKIWNVRKSCVEVTMSLARYVLPHRNILASLMINHIQDESKWVRLSAFEILGPFISIFAKQLTSVTHNQYGELVFSYHQDLELKNNTIPCPSSENILGKCGFIANEGDEWNDSQHSDNTCELYRDYSDYHLHGMNVDNRDKDSENNDIDNEYNSFQYFRIPAETQPLDLELLKMTCQVAQETSSLAEPVNDNHENFNSPKIIDLYAVDSEENEQLPNSPDLDSKSNNSSFEPMSDKDYNNWLEDDNPAEDNAEAQNSSLGRRKKDDSFNLNTFIMEELPFYELDCGGIVPQILVNSFVSLVDVGDEAMSEGLKHYCAFSFPAVVLTLGRDNWHHLKTAYQSLSLDCVWKVRLTIASSIHEVAAILGEELSATDLVPIYEEFIKDLDEVRIGVLKHLNTFLKLLSPKSRKYLLPKLQRFLSPADNICNWRFRQILAQELWESLELFEKHDVSQYVAPIGIHMLEDKVAAVRNDAIVLISAIVKYYGTDYGLTLNLINQIKGNLIPVKSEVWVRRQTFVLLCSELVSTNSISGPLFAKILLIPLIELSNDQVPNIRLVVARTLSRDLLTKDPHWFETTGAWLEVDRTVKTMCSDLDRDVRLFAHGWDQTSEFSKETQDEP